MLQLPIVMQVQPSQQTLAQDAAQFKEVPVIAIADALPVARGEPALFTVSLLDSPPPLTVRVFIQGSTPSSGAFAGPAAGDQWDSTVPALDYLNFDETIVLTQTDTVVAVSTVGGTPPFSDPTTFVVNLQAVDAAFVLRAQAVGTIETATDYHVYAPGVYADGVYQ